MEDFTDKILDISFDKDKIIRFLNKKEIEEIKKESSFSYFFKLRRQFKILLLDFFNLFSFDKNVVYVKDRSLEKVKNKYDNIAGSYIGNYLDSKKKFVAQIQDNQVVELRGSKEDYYSQYLNNIITKTNSKSLLEVGAGELTLAAEVIKNLKKDFLDYTGALYICLYRLSVGN